MSQKVHAMHGRDHLLDGADPIPLRSTTGSATYPDAILAIPSLWAHWPLDEASGDPVDIVGGRVLTATASPTYGLAGPFDGLPELTAMGFAGAAYLTRNFVSPEPVGASDPFTMMAWCYPTSTAQMAIVNIHSGLSEQTSLYKPDPNLYFQRRSTAGAGAAMTPLANWRYVVFTFSGAAGGTCKTYLDGSLVNTSTVTGAQANNTFRVGAQGSPIGNFFEGRIAQVSLFTSDLSAADISGLYALRSATGAAGSGYVLTADGVGGASWAAPTIEVTF